MTILCAFSAPSSAIIVSGEVRGYLTRNTYRFGYAWNNDTLYCPSNAGSLLELNVQREVVASYAVDDFTFPHQSLYHDGRIIVTDSGHPSASIWVLDLETQKQERFGTGGGWINSINLIEGEFWVMDHRHGESRTHVYDTSFRLLRTYEATGRMAHNLWKMDGDVWLCSSAEGAIQTIDGRRSINIGGFTRGVAMDSHHLYVGVSRPRHSARWSPNLSQTANGVAVIDRRSLEQVDFISLKASEISELRLVDELDLAHPSDSPLRFSWGDLPSVSIIALEDPIETLTEKVVASLRGGGSQPVVLGIEALTESTATPLLGALLHQGYAPVLILPPNSGRLVETLRTAFSVPVVFSSRTNPAADILLPEGDAWAHFTLIRDKLMAMAMGGI